MEEEPAERVTTHHRSVGKEGLRKRGWRDGGGVRYWSRGLNCCWERAQCPCPYFHLNCTQDQCFLKKCFIVFWVCFGGFLMLFSGSGLVFYCLNWPLVQLMVNLRASHELILVQKRCRSLFQNFISSLVLQMLSVPASSSVKSIHFSTVEGTIV